MRLHLSILTSFINNFFIAFPRKKPCESKKVINLLHLIKKQLKLLIALFNELNFSWMQIFLSIRHPLIYALLAQMHFFFFVYN